MALLSPAAKKYASHRAWWKESTVYQIYPASFCHSSSNTTPAWSSPDGLTYGNIRGIISKLSYIADLGVDVLWLSPILKSPQVDMGYDISDYCAIDERYGNMQDYEELLSEAKKRNLRVVMDLVVNHTSDQHAWFKESKAAGKAGAGSGKKGSKRDWYIWRPARYDVKGYEGQRMPPNNWESAFSGSAWSWDEGSQEYYLHLFAKEQPDLNWENPEVTKEVLGVVRWWLERGVGGFRMDVINFISKAYGEDLGLGDGRRALPDGKVTRPGFLQSGMEHFANGPRIHEFFREIQKVLGEFDAFSVGEMPGVKDTDEVLRSVGWSRGELAMAFQFDVVSMDLDETKGHGKWWPKKFEAKTMKGVVGKWQRTMIEGDGWNGLFLENHDQGRSVSRYGSEEGGLRMVSAKMLASFLVCQSGTVFVYQGQELGMVNVPKSWGMERYKDIECLNHWETVKRDFGADEGMQRMFKEQYRLIGRDNARTPIQWNGKEGAGFVEEGSGLRPWMDVHEDYKEWNAEKLVGDEGSSYHYWRRLLEWRKKEKDLIVYGDFGMLDKEDRFGDVVAYVRRSEEKIGLVIASFGKGDVRFEVPGEYVGILKSGVVEELRNYKEEVELDGNVVTLRPFEVLVAVSKI